VAPSISTGIEQQAGQNGPRAIEIQLIDLSPDWTRGIRRLVAMMRREVAPGHPVD
jgi:hypothetical protein